MRIRVAQPKDKQAVSQLYYKLHPEIKGKKSPPISKFKAGSTILVAEKKNKIAGFIWITFVQYGISKIGYIEELYIDKEWRRKKIGTHLVNKAIAYLKQLKTDVVFVSVSLEKKEALKFYERLRFGKCKGYWLYKKLN
jgi:ribosomal protein S18 acetylase RimI-like enzyme